MKTGTAPWWKRGWHGWWINQRTTLRLEDPMGQYIYDDARQEVSWQGCFVARDKRRWSVEVCWGPGTPFMPPRIYVDAAYSRVHQLRDRSLCLAPPQLAAVVEIEDWLEQTRTWLERYVREGWGMSETEWQLKRRQLPGPGYRLHERPRTRILVPADWSPAGTPAEFVACLPTGPGLGTLLRWRGARESTWHVWERGTLFAPAGGKVLPGYLLPESDGPLPAPVSDWLARPEPQEAPWILCRRLPPEQQSLWMFWRPDLPLWQAQVFLQRLLLARGGPAELAAAKQEIRSLQSERSFPGLPLAPDMTAARTQVSRSEQVDAQIRGACVVVVGLGALGSEVVHLLAKEQVGSFVLVDGDLMLPGNVARHRLDLSSVGGNKAEKMREYLLRHHPGAAVEVVTEMLDEALPRLKLPEHALMLGMTGDLSSERILAALSAARQLPCVHAWTECDGRLLRLIRMLPGREPGLHELRRIPEVPWPQSPAAARRCAELVQPGSSINLHAAANRTARLVMEMLSDTSPSSLSSENHIFFTAEGLGRASEGIHPALCSPYGQLIDRIGQQS